jgi:hypothetical protein
MILAHSLNILEPRKQSFNLLSLLVSSQGPPAPRFVFLSPLTMRSNEDNVSLLQLFIEWIGIVGPISHKDIWSISGKSFSKLRATDPARYLSSKLFTVPLTESSSAAINRIELTID